MLPGDCQRQRDGYLMIITLIRFAYLPRLLIASSSIAAD